MNENATGTKAGEEERRLAMLFLLMALVWTVLLVAFVRWSYRQSYAAALEMARGWARNSQTKDVVFRQWASLHGGVYVPITPQTPPNPYLVHLPERDIVTPSGKKLTLMNPAYMTRQVHELGQKRDGLQGHITSLRPIRPENAPDAWETQALQAFERGAQEVVSLDQIGSETYLRLMRALVTEPACLKCHEPQGYHVGDIRGGLSTSVPWKPSQERLRAQLQGLALRAGGLWALGFLGLCLVWWRLQRDLSRRERHAQQQAEWDAQLKIINQELKDFAYIVSHDLRAPLRGIRTLADWLCADYQDKLDPQGQESLRLLGSRVDRMQNLINGVLRYSRVGRTEQERVSVDLNQLLPQIVGSLGAPNHIAIDVQPDLPTVQADVTRITQVFQNLLSNAIKYMDKPQGSIAVGCVEDQDFWTFHVRDNGPGIDRRHFERIFKLFQTLAPRDECESTGVGLAVAKKIVEMYGGRIWVESEVGQGSTFFFTFPKRQEETHYAYAGNLDHADDPVAGRTHGNAGQEA
jgi:signal transduction histidine kinase